MTLPFDKMVERFNTGKNRYDAMGTWPGSISEIDPETNISRDITDEEIRNSDATAGGRDRGPRQALVDQEVSHKPNFCP